MDKGGKGWKRMEKDLDRETVPCAARSRWVTPCPSIFSNPFLMISCTAWECGNHDSNCENSFSKSPRYVWRRLEMFGDVSKRNEPLESCYAHFAGCCLPTDEALKVKVKGNYQKMSPHRRSFKS